MAECAAVRPEALRESEAMVECHLYAAKAVVAG
jgi:hypothetical protein